MAIAKPLSEVLLEENIFQEINLFDSPSAQPTAKDVPNLLAEVPDRLNDELNYNMGIENPLPVNNEERSDLISYVLLPNHVYEEIRTTLQNLKKSVDVLINKQNTTCCQNCINTSTPLQTHYKCVEFLPLKTVSNLLEFEELLSNNVENFNNLGEDFVGY